MKETKDLTLFGNGERGNGERGNRSLWFLTTYKYDVLPKKDRDKWGARHL